MNTFEFPQFRRYKNVETYFKIISLDSFEEIRSLGKNWIVENHQVMILPDRNFLHDLLVDYHSFADEISADVYSAIEQLVGK